MRRRHCGWQHSSGIERCRVGERLIPGDAEVLRLAAEGLVGYGERCVGPREHGLLTKPPTARCILQLAVPQTRPPYPADHMCARRTE